MKLSIVIPAYNEEKYLLMTLEALNTALAGHNDTEVIVVDNASTDGTRDIAGDFGAKVVDEPEHVISKVRNTGGANASGTVLVFIDADTLVRPGLFEKILEVMTDDKCLGGSVAVEYDQPTRNWRRYYLMGWQFWGRVLKMRQGAAQFCRKSAFTELGGYDTSIFMGEDIEFQWRLARLARTTVYPLLTSARSKGYTTFIKRPRVLTSSRRYSKMGLVKTLVLTHPITILLAWRIKSLWKDWYENAVR